MKKRFAFIIVLFLTASLLGRGAWAAEEDKPNPILQACNSLLDEDKNFALPFPEVPASISDDEREQLFAQGQQIYHGYIECILNQAYARILTSTGSDFVNVFASHTPNIPSLLKPDTACLNIKDFEKILQETAIGNFLVPLQEKGVEYQDFINNKLLKAVTGSKQGNDFVQRMHDEMEQSSAALRYSLDAFKEMRTQFAMHTQLQCILKELQVYRDLLKKVRGYVSSYPKLFDSASTVCPNG